MTEEELNGWAEDFEAFHARFAPIFGRKEPRQQAQKYVRGLLATVERKNSWHLAETVGDRIPCFCQLKVSQYGGRKEDQLD
jgi:hypothetical protein